MLNGDVTELSSWFLGSRLIISSISEGWRMCKFTHSQEETCPQRIPWQNYCSFHVEGRISHSEVFVCLEDAHLLSESICKQNSHIQANPPNSLCWGWAEWFMPSWRGQMNQPVEVLAAADSDTHPQSARWSLPWYLRGIPRKWNAFFPIFLWRGRLLMFCLLTDFDSW